MIVLSNKPMDVIRYRRTCSWISHRPYYFFSKCKPTRVHVLQIDHRIPNFCGYFIVEECFVTEASILNRAFFYFDYAQCHSMAQLSTLGNLFSTLLYDLTPMIYDQNLIHISTLLILNGSLSIICQYEKYSIPYS